MGLALDKRQDVISKATLDSARLAMTLFDVLSLMRSNQSNFQNIAESIKFDPATANRLLGKVNSPLFQLDEPIKKLPHAVSILGIRQVRELLLQATDKNFYHRYIKIESELARLKEHGLAVACYAEEFAKQTRQYMTSEFYQAGLMHDIGKTAMLVALGDDYLKVIRESDSMNYSLHLHERDTFGFDHIEIGEEIAYAWEFEDSLRFVIKYHHEVTEEQLENITTREARLVQIVSFANLMNRIDPRGKSSRGVFRSFGSDLPQPPSDLTITQINAISERAQARYSEILRNLGLKN